MGEEENTPIPEKLDEALNALERLLTRETRDELVSGESQPSFLHFGMGMGIRNSWRLWSGSPLARYFNSIGIFHPDDMSGIILRSLARRLRGEDIRLEEQVEEYRRFRERDTSEPWTPRTLNQTP